MSASQIDFGSIRAVIAGFELSPRVEPNEAIEVDRAFLPEGHRGVLDLKRQLVVGNRGMGKSFWTHALVSQDLRTRLAKVYGYPSLGRTEVIIGFNGSQKVNPFAPTIDEISTASEQNPDPDLIWKGVFLRAVIFLLTKETPSLTDAINILSENPNLYSYKLSELDNKLSERNETLLIVFDALDRLASDWSGIRSLTRSLLSISVGLQSFRSIRAKIFMRVDQFSDHEIFRFRDSSKIRNDHVNLIWQPNELYGLLLFEILRNPEGSRSLRDLAALVSGTRALPTKESSGVTEIDEQTNIINAISGEFMGASKKRGRVYTWVSLHLSDADNTCSPRSFLIAWKKAAEHHPVPSGRAVDHLGLLDGVRSASTSRLAELYEDYPWIRPALDALRRQFVPIERAKMFELWDLVNVSKSIIDESVNDSRNAPVGFLPSGKLDIVLSAMKSVAVMEERTNGKVNVPDIFRVEAEILRKGGVAVPKRG